MRLRIIGSGDAFGSGGRANACFLLETGQAIVSIDFGATSLVEMRRSGIDPRSIDVILLSHLHGDHFGAIPALLLFRQFACKQRRPLTIVGPVGTRERLLAASEIFYPGTSAIDWKFELTVIDLPTETPWSGHGVGLLSHEVIHPSGAPATGLRIAASGRLLAYSGDTEWTEALTRIAADADLFICECYHPYGTPVSHMSLQRILEERERLRAKSIMLTHMGETMLERIDEALAEGLLIARDGLIHDF
ncbi:MBL fold metallo-hydrolase [Enterovirga rhinocerotis]|nr:MBL fold metallo-hydrolase [Enterovirga rhinocerotis]